MPELAREYRTIVQLLQLTIRPEISVLSVIEHLRKMMTAMVSFDQL